MIKSIAIYPHHIDEHYELKIKETAELAAQYGFNEVFTTLHLPEFSLAQQLDCLKIICNYAEKNNLSITVDIGGEYINEILRSKEYSDTVKKLKIAFIRLDYGFSKKQINDLYNSFNIRGFVVNASIYSEDEINEIVSEMKEIDEKLEIRGCHNFYVRNETGIDETLAMRQDSYFRKYEIPVCYCIPSYSNPRGPLFSGLCTLEKHRFISIEEAVADLIIKYQASYVMMADEWLTEREFKEFSETVEILTRPLMPVEDIHVRLADTVTDEERNIVLGQHVFRYDSPDCFLRSQTSRQMAEYARRIKTGNTVKRTYGSVTVDNARYKRYSGELQVVMTEAEQDDKVNVVGIITDREELLKLKRFREKTVYRFVEDDK